SSLCFASAHVETVPFPEALDMVLASRKGKRVAYLQQQNDCFRSEYGPLAADCEDHVPWATEALGCSPEAVNLWVGTDASETSFHKDHYENLYVVIAGEKRFLLLPPTEVHRMYITDYPAARYLYHKGSGQFSIEVDGSVTVPWSSVDPYPEPDEKQRAMERFPLYYNGPTPLQVTVKAGQMLYLPSMWFHHVRQVQDGSGGLTVAVNYWYDMQFDSRYAYFNFLQSIPRHEIENKEANLESSRCNGSD
ncbi:phospholipase-like protein, partial [Genlisea aurea]